MKQNVCIKKSLRMEGKNEENLTRGLSCGISVLEQTVRKQVYIDNRDGGSRNPFAIKQVEDKQI